MKHIDEIKLIEYVAGNLSEHQAIEVRDHIAACAECLQRVQETQKLSDTLSQWDVETAGHDVANRVIAQAQKVQHPAMNAFRARLLPQVLRVAASIIIAIGFGHKLGEYSVDGGKPQLESSQQKPEYVAALGLEWSSGLAWLVLEDNPAETGGEQ